MDDDETFILTGYNVSGRTFWRVARGVFGIRATVRAIWTRAWRVRADGTRRLVVTR